MNPQSHIGMLETEATVGGTPTPSLQALIILIPAYQPQAALVQLVAELVRLNVARIIVVDDGSGPECQPIYDQVARHGNVEILRHLRNLGKGAALKTGLSYILCRVPDCQGVITADADAQHDPDDIARVAGSLATDNRRLVLGVRRLGSSAPWRSRFGNALTRVLFRALYGLNLTDTQTGLRGIPIDLAPTLLKVDHNGYEFELEMLIVAKHIGLPIAQVPIRTIYHSGKASSHFDPIFDSLWIFLLLLRFGAVFLLMWLLDNVVFYLAFQLVPSIFAAQLIGRLTAMALSYPLNRRLAFLRGNGKRRVLLRFLLVLLGSGSVSYCLLKSFQSLLDWPVFTAKAVAETLLFVVNFALLRDFVFSARAERSERRTASVTSSKTAEFRQSVQRSQAGA